MEIWTMSISISCSVPSAYVRVILSLGHEKGQHLCQSGDTLNILALVHIYNSADQTSRLYTELRVYLTKSLECFLLCLNSDRGVSQSREMGQLLY